jgi:hypothetical protein
MPSQTTASISLPPEPEMLPWQALTRAALPQFQGGFSETREPVGQVHTPDPVFHVCSLGFSRFSHDRLVDSGQSMTE